MRSLVTILSLVLLALALCEARSIHNGNGTCDTQAITKDVDELGTLTTDLGTNVRASLKTILQKLPQCVKHPLKFASCILKTVQSVESQIMEYVNNYSSAVQADLDQLSSDVANCLSPSCDADAVQNDINELGTLVTNLTNEINESFDTIMQQLPQCAKHPLSFVSCAVKAVSSVAPTLIQDIDEFTSSVQTDVKQLATDISPCLSPSAVA